MFWSCKHWSVGTYLFRLLRIDKISSDTCVCFWFYLNMQKRIFFKSKLLICILTNFENTLWLLLSIKCFLLHFSNHSKISKIHFYAWLDDLIRIGLSRINDERLLWLRIRFWSFQFLFSFRIISRLKLFLVLRLILHFTHWRTFELRLWFRSFSLWRWCWLLKDLALKQKRILIRIDSLFQFAINSVLASASSWSSNAMQYSINGFSVIFQ